MGKLKITNDEYSFISDSGIEYSIYEGYTLGKGRQKPTDIVFIVFDLYDSINETVYNMYGACGLDENDEYGLNIINFVVNEWESKHPGIVQGIKDGTIEHC